MARLLLRGVVVCLVASSAAAQTEQTPGSRTVFSDGNENLSAGADAIRAGQYDDGIRLTTMGLERGANLNDKAAALSNLCAAYAVKGQLDLAIKTCTDSLALRDGNWRAYSNRSYAYYLKGMYAQANTDLEAAAAISPEARQVAQIRGMINERSLRPSVIVEEHR